MNHLLSYSEAIHPLYFLTRFVEGLRADIRAVVLIQRPIDLEAAGSLALLQEELAEGFRRERPRRSDAPTPRAAVRTAPLPLPAAPSRGGGLAGAEDRRALEAARPAQDADKVATLRAYRRAKGLCFTCGERWGRDHRCPANVPLHVIEELLQMLESEEEYTPPAGEQQDDANCAAISCHTLEGTASPKALQLQGWLGDTKVLLLIDSGSSSSFIRNDLVRGEIQSVPLARRLRVRVADGGELACTQEVPDCQWWSHGQEFRCNLKVLPLLSYDIILGMDWLESHSPMQVDWEKKYVEFQHHGSTIRLQGLPSSDTTCATVSAMQLQALCKENASLLVLQLCQVVQQQPLPMPPQVAELLSRYKEVFDEPTGMPPKRACDHRIPLLPGAQPFAIRPYRYSPALKTEIERQVADLLQKGIIQVSQSPFSSPVVLVRKKDLTWRMCVDYRRLNALTCKTTFPIPVIDELLDELAGARWFSKLDLRSGYHQIRLAEGEAPKTAFQTHSGHYEYKVVSFGLAYAPATFQGAMNVTLSPVSRKCVLVFFDNILVFSVTFEDHLRDLEEVLGLLKKDQWQVNESKCLFAQQQLSYLGHRISAEGVTTEESKIATVRDWPVPESVRKLKGFLGLAGYYRKFVRHFGMISKPLTQLLRKGALFVWTDESHKAFTALKEALISALVLALPDFTKTFVVETDACDKGIGAVLQQDGHPIAFLSKALGPKAAGLSTYEKSAWRFCTQLTNGATTCKWLNL